MDERRTRERSPGPSPPKREPQRETDVAHRMDVDPRSEDDRPIGADPTQAVERQAEKVVADDTKEESKAKESTANDMPGVVKSEDAKEKEGAKDKEKAQVEEKKERKDVAIHPPTAPRRQPPTQPRGHGLSQPPSSPSRQRGPLHGLSHAPASRASQSPLRPTPNASGSTSANPPASNAGATVAVTQPTSLPIPLGPRSDRALPSGPRADRLKGKDHHEKEKEKEKEKERVKEDTKESETTPAPQTPAPSLPVIPSVKKTSLTPDLDAELARLQSHRHALQREHTLTLFPAVQRAGHDLALAKLDLKAAETKRKNAEEQLPTVGGFGSSGLFSSGSGSGGTSSVVY